MSETTYTEKEQEEIVYYERALGGLETETCYPPAVVDESPKVKEPAEARRSLSRSAQSLFQISPMAQKTTPSVPTTDLYQIPLALTHPR
ncbi:hypothetical protein MTO96_001371 [Rhipicephalus appendiculatus]